VLEFLWRVLWTWYFGYFSVERLYGYSLFGP
jgi:hypothetical protein